MRKDRVVGMNMIVRSDTSVADAETDDPIDTDRSSDRDALGAYLHEVGRYPLVNAEREIELSKAIEAGHLVGERIVASRNSSLSVEDARLRVDGEAARLELINANLRLVIAIARKYRWTGLPLLDLIQEGNIGLIRAVTKFDWRKGFKFSTYATWWVRQAIRRGIADKGRMIRLPSHVHGEVLAIGRARTGLLSELGREPTDAEVAKRTWISKTRVAELRSAGYDVLSLELPVGFEGESTLGDFIADEGAGSSFADVLARISRDEALKVIATLNEREQRIIALRFGLAGGEPLTLEEVGKVFDLTRERIRQLEAKALSKLRHPSRMAALRTEA